MINKIFSEILLPFHLQHLSDSLSQKMKDDALMYDILAVSKETIIFYFLEPNEMAGGVGFFTEENIPDSVFASGTLVGFVHAHHENSTAIHARIFITMPFAEKEEEGSFQSPPRKTKYPIMSKANIDKGINGLNKWGFGKWVDINKIGQDLFNRYNNITLIEDVIGVDEKRQYQIEIDIKNRNKNHQHTQLHYNQLRFKPDSIETSDCGAVFALHWFDHGGAEKFALMSMKKAFDMGFKVYCVVDKRGNKHYMSQAREICTHIFNIAEGLPVNYWHRFYVNLCIRLNVKLFHIHHAISAYQALPKIKTLTSVSTILDTTHIIEHSDGGYARISGVFSQYLNYHHIISQELKEYLANEIHVPHNKLKLGYLFNQYLKPSSNCNKFNDIGKKCIISFIGRLVNQKRPYLFIELVHRIMNIDNLKNIDFEFNMIGEGPLGDVCKQIITQYKLASKINLLPADSDVDELLRDSHFLIIPSENEGLTLVAYEAVLNNCIVISSDVGSQREITSPDALFPRFPRKFLDGTVDLIEKSIYDDNLICHLLQEQKSRIESISSQSNWELVLESIYSEVENNE